MIHLLLFPGIKVYIAISKLTRTIFFPKTRKIKTKTLQNRKVAVLSVADVKPRQELVGRQGRRQTEQ